MNSRERVFGFLNRIAIDRVPVQLQNMAVTVRSLGMTFPEVYQDGQLVAEGHMVEWETYGHDGVIVDIGTHAAAQSIGCEVDYPDGEIPRVVGGALGDIEEIDDLALPDPHTTFPLVVMIEAVAILKREIGKGAMIIATVDQGPFTLSSQIVGMQTFLMKLAAGESEDQIFRLLEFCRDFTLTYGKALYRAGADIIRMGDSMSGPDIISPRMYERYAFPFQRSLSQAFKKEGIPFDFHICGDATSIVHRMVETGATFVEIDEKTDLSAAREAVKDRGGVGGTISPQLLRFGTTEAVEQSCKSVLEAWMPRKGLFFGTGCTLAPDTPETNIRKLMHCAEIYGSY